MCPKHSISTKKSKTFIYATCHSVLLWQWRSSDTRVTGKKGWITRVLQMSRVRNVERARSDLRPAPRPIVKITIVCSSSEITASGGGDANGSNGGSNANTRYFFNHPKPSLLTRRERWTFIFKYTTLPD